MFLVYKTPLVYVGVLDGLVPALGAHTQPILAIAGIPPTSFESMHQLVLLYTDALQGNLYNHEY